MATNGPKEPGRTPEPIPKRPIPEIFLAALHSKMQWRSQSESQQRQYENPSWSLGKAMTGLKMWSRQARLTKLSLKNLDGKPKGRLMSLI